MEEKKCCTNEHEAIKGIHCDVHNCVYNEKGCACHAPQISVGPTYACSSAETVCVTFKAKAEG